MSLLQQHGHDQTLEKTLWRGGRVLSPSSPAATALLTEGDRIAWVGPDADAPAADRTVDLDGALVTPAFVDSHVHLTGTGASLVGLHLAGSRSAAEVLERVAETAEALAPDAVVLAGGWDETAWADPALPAAEAVERAAGGRLVYLSRTCGHTGIAGPRLLAEHPGLAGLDGFEASGVLTRAAHRAARAHLQTAVPVAQRLADARAGLAHAASLGIAAVAEMAVPNPADPLIEDEFQGLIALGGEPGLPAVYGWWGELAAAEKARDLGAHGCGGDLSVDGSIGARTAFLRQPYRDTDTVGAQYLTAEDVAAHLLDCHRVGLPAAFHAIGDAAVETVLDGLDRVEDALGIDAIRQARHRIEHAELLDSALIARMVHHGVHASVQPAFDAAWGGLDGMYAARLGRARALAANPLSKLAGVGVPLAFGSDSPVTALDPWGGVRAALLHHYPVSRLPMAAAFSAATRGGWRALGIADSGSLAPSMRANFTVWDLTVEALPDLSDPDSSDPTCSMTVAGGRLVYSRA
ncbi:amidohydrolase family protein [Glycomyces sp. TRM65418]|uniref:amidohydrolase n=1 Tax=Glycomyces sp. TRM65418 TaxID=2867006 RepID=UPI001CE6F1C8|nr:amidohydrolase family protein [Glycomyces sp. TRM65418]MCC3763045.1 amidohydrolase family protein [Glycomyces sp. TRM65418]QZD57059.1 amidohydrolase family protein [Glycomyces sp. TRM65418]